MKTLILAVAFLAVVCALPSYRDDEYRMYRREYHAPSRYHDDPRRYHDEANRREYDAPSPYRDHPRRHYVEARRQFDAPRARSPYDLRDYQDFMRRQEVLADLRSRSDPIQAPEPKAPVSDIADLESLDEVNLPATKEIEDEPLARVANDAINDVTAQDAVKVIDADVKVEETPDIVEDSGKALEAEAQADAPAIIEKSAKPLEVVKDAEAPEKTIAKDTAILTAIKDAPVAKDSDSLAIVKDEPLSILNDAPKREASASSNQAYDEILNAKLPESPKDEVVADAVVVKPVAADPAPAAPVAPVAPAVADPVAVKVADPAPVAPAAPVAADPAPAAPAAAPVAADPVVVKAVAADPAPAAPVAPAAAPVAADPVVVKAVAADPAPAAPVAPAVPAAAPIAADPVPAAPVAPAAPEAPAEADTVPAGLEKMEELATADVVEENVGDAKETVEIAKDPMQDRLYQAVHDFLQHEREAENHRREMMARRRDYIRRVMAQRAADEQERQERRRNDPYPHFDPTGRLRNYRRSRQMIPARDEY